MTVTICHAAHCSDEIHETKVFCGRHWAILPLKYKQTLVDCYGGPYWARVLEECRKMVFLRESRLSSQSTRTRDAQE